MTALKTLVGALAVASIAATASTAAARTGERPVHMGVFARTGLRLTDVVWSGRQFLYVENTTNRVAASGPSGMPLTPFAAMPHQVEETRCRPSPGAHGFAAGDLYCHAPGNTIYRISPDGHVSAFATLPHAPRSDGALTFDTVGTFGYALLAATGRSGGGGSRGGAVFTIDPAGKVRRIGSYDAPGGADEMAIAPARFGALSGQVLLAVDAGSRGSLVSMNARGQARTLLALPDGPNPLVALTPGQTPRAGAARPGLYVTDTLSRAVYFVSAAELRPYAGAVVVGTELRGLFWVVRPRGNGVAAVALPTTLAGTKWNFEGAIYVAG